MGIQTSSDVNGDGVIDTDCNRNMVPDDLADVAKKACVNGKAQEFYGLDDECVLFTTNVNVPNMVGRPIALGKGTEDGTPSDAWAGCYNDAKFFRIDGATGLTKAQAVLPNPPMGQAGPKSNPYGAVIDAKGILWATNLGGGLRYFDTNQPAMAGAARDPKGYALGGYGITLDRDQNVWVAGYSGGVNATPNDAYRYTPDRTKPFATLGDGFWTRVNAPGAGSGAPASSSRGIASDSRTDKIYFVWMALTAGWVLRIDASTIAAPNGIDKTVDGTNMPAMKIAGDGTIGAGVDADQNVWGVSRTGSVATRIKVDINGKMTPPDILAGISGMGCPVGNGDRCSLVLNGTMSDPQPYTYSDFTGFGLKNFTLPKGSYQYTLKGCAMGKTTWGKIIYDVTLPPGTKVTVRARSGATAVPDNTWGAFTGEYLASPADLAQKPGPLVANPAPYLQVEFNLSTLDQAVSPKLKSFEATYSCL
ncbi:MAG: hypothetical protein EXR72_04190 [Myxococcales bacterium]|nr:hypothetical protein [Myxococcales bacterium]